MLTHAKYLKNHLLMIIFFIFLERKLDVYSISKAVFALYVI